jgi:hypothetical protein
MNETNFSDPKGLTGIMAAGWIRDLESSDSRIHKEKTIEKALMASLIGQCRRTMFPL